MATGAETSTNESQEKPKRLKKPRGMVWINVERCKGCGYCIEFCPVAVLGFSEKFNVKGYHYPEVIKPDACIGCDLCGMYCPDFAIYGARVSDSDSAKE